MTRPKATEIARNKWPAILAQLGVDARALDGKNHPCPKDGEGKDRFRFTDRNGSGSYFCHCDERARGGQAGGLSLLMCCRNWTYQQACEEVERIAGTIEVPPPRTSKGRDVEARKRDILATCKPCSEGDAVSRYLAARGLAPTPAIQQGRAKYWDTTGDKPQLLGEFDVMVTRLRAPDGTPQALHLTYLGDGAKADVPSPRKMIGESVTGSAIRLGKVAEEMGVAEGIETALACAAEFALPVWSCHCASMLAGFIPPPAVKTLWIFADNDANATGQLAAYKLKSRMHAKGIAAHVMVPPREGTDWDDERRNRAA